MKDLKKILVVDDDKSHREAVADWLVKDGYNVLPVADGSVALNHLYDGISVILTDLKLPKVDGMELLKTARKRVPHVVVFLLTGSASVESAIEAMKSGASDFLIKPINLQELSVKIGQAIEQGSMSDEIAALHAQLKKRDELYKMIGRSDSMRKIFEHIRLVAPTNATVMITGESGTGKELVAKAIHAHSSRSNKPFLPVNFAAIAESLIESELFGHEAGSFTGASKRCDGVFQSADSGTLFLDEIGDLQFGLQSKLLRALENKAVMRVGSQKEEQVDVRMVAATNSDLRQKVVEGDFREDLFYRLNVVNICLPPLRERPDDIPLLASHFVDKIAREHDRPATEISPELMDRLCAYHWPGNVRELRNTLESMVVMSLAKRLEFDALPSHIRELNLDRHGARDLRRGRSLQDLEVEAIRCALGSHAGHRKATADILGISVRTLQRKIKEFNLE